VKILTLAPIVPNSDMPYAGAQYYFRHLSVLAEDNEVTLIAPDTDANRQAKSAAPQNVAVVLVSPGRQSMPGVLARFCDLVYNFQKVLTPGRRLQHPLEACAGQCIESRGADLVEVHWPEYAGLLPRLRSMTSVPIAFYSHDVFSQKIERLSEKSRQWRVRLRARLVRGRAGRIEAKLLSYSTCVLVFSDKDVELLDNQGLNVPVTVITPPLSVADMPSIVEVEEPWHPQSVLFEGALDRPPNHDAAMWLVHEIWPVVIRSCANARLTIAGAGATTELVRAVSDSDRVEMTGFVADWSVVYKRADIAVVPLRLGAGLKFKVASAMLWGKPVVATTVGAEGYPIDAGIFAAVTDEAHGLATEIIRILNSTTAEDINGTTTSAHSWANGKFSEEAFRRQILALYTHLFQGGNDDE
jgi:glycosyltransferase involved in cell wall biosynthesis